MAKTATARAQASLRRPAHPVENVDIARILDEIADLLEIQGRGAHDRDADGPSHIVRCRGSARHAARNRRPLEAGIPAPFRG